MCSTSVGRQTTGLSTMARVSYRPRKTRIINSTSSLPRKRNSRSSLSATLNCQRPTTVRKNTLKGRVPSLPPSRLTTPANRGEPYCKGDNGTSRKRPSSPIPDYPYNIPPLLFQSKLTFPLLFQRRGRGGLSNNVPISIPSPSLWEGRGGYRGGYYPLSFR